MCTGHWPFKQKRRRKEEKHKRPATELAILKSKIVERAPASAVDCPTASTPHTGKKDKEGGGEEQQQRTEGARLVAQRQKP